MKITTNISPDQAVRVANDALNKLEQLERRVADLEKKVTALYGGPISHGA